MALRTIGTNGTATLNGLIMSGNMAASDVAAVAMAIRSDATVGQIIAPGHFDQTGRLFFPGGRGFLMAKPGDFVAVDSFGFPCLVSANSLAFASTSWTHT